MAPCGGWSAGRKGSPGLVGVTGTLEWARTLGAESSRGGLEDSEESLRVAVVEVNLEAGWSGVGEGGWREVADGRERSGASPRGKRTEVEKARVRLGEEVGRVSLR